MRQRMSTNVLSPSPSLIHHFTAANATRSLCQERAREVQCKNCKLANQRPWRAQRLHTQRGSDTCMCKQADRLLMQGWLRDMVHKTQRRQKHTPIGTMSTRNQLCRPPPRTEPIRKPAAVIPAAFPAPAQTAPVIKNMSGTPMLTPALVRRATTSFRWCLCLWTLQVLQVGPQHRTTESWSSCMTHRGWLACSLGGNRPMRPLPGQAAGPAPLGLPVRGCLAALPMPENVHAQLRPTIQLAADPSTEECDSMGLLKRLTTSCSNMQSRAAATFRYSIHLHRLSGPGSRTREA